MNKVKRGLILVLILMLLLVIPLVLIRHMAGNLTSIDRTLLPLDLIQQTVGTEAPLSVLGDYYYADNSSRLVCLAAEGADVSTFYAVELEKELFHTKCRKLTLTERGPNIYVLLWGNGYVFMVGNPDIAYMELGVISPSPQMVRVPVSSVPFSYYCDWNTWDIDGDPSTCRYQYLFYNHEGKAVS